MQVHVRAEEPVRAFLMDAFHTPAVAGATWRAHSEQCAYRTQAKEGLRAGGEFLIDKRGGARWSFRKLSVEASARPHKTRP